MTLLMVVFAIGVVIGAYALLAPCREDPPAPHREDSPAPQPAYSLLISPVDEIGETYKRLSEAARCDVVLAITEIENEYSQRILELALDDASEAVNLAAVHVLTRAGHSERVTDYVAEHHDDERAGRLVETIGLLS